MSGENVTAASIDVSRLSSHYIGTGVFGCILASIFHGDQMLTMSSLIGTCLLAQILSPWDPAAAIAQPYTCRRRGGS